MSKIKIIEQALKHLGIQELNAMQQAVLLQQESSGEDLILLSPTGTGKTLAYLLPLLLNLNPDTSVVQSLILVPSRELALQVASVFKSMNSSWKVCCCYGGHPISEEKKTILGNRPEVIIGTPGRLGDHLRKGNFSPQTIHTLIIDEFDKSLELGFQEQMTEIVEQLPALQKRILISATDMEEIPEFTGLKKTVKLNFLAKEEEQEEKLTLYRVTSLQKDKIDTLYRLLCVLGNESSIVFCNHRESADRVSALLSKKGMPNVLFHGGMEQPERERSLYKFRNGSCFVLVSTDLAARGLDIPEVRHIIHYHLPVSEEAFTHRNGRTARWDKRGNCYLVLNEQDKIPAYLPEEIEEWEQPATLGSPAKPLWTTLYIGKGKKDKLNKIDIAGFFYKKGKLSREDMGAIDVKEHYAFVAVRTDKVKNLLIQIAGEKIKGMKTIIEKIK